MKKKILVVDDDHEISEIIKTVLEEKGTKVDINFDPKNIKQKILRSNPDILFIDYNIPGIDVKELIKYTKKNPTTSEIKIILTSGSSNIIKIGKKLGVETLAKPFDIENLTRYI